jgi:hypothetical protein
MKTLQLLFVALTLVAFGYETPTASAQTDWGAAWKANGMRGMRDDSTSTSRSRSYARRSYVPSETRQMFSYEPLDFRVGDKVVVTKDSANLKVERTILATLSKGQVFTVTHIQGPWVATTLEIDGKKLNGWVWFDQVKAPPATPAGRADR